MLKNLLMITISINVMAIHAMNTENKEKNSKEKIAFIIDNNHETGLYKLDIFVQEKKQGFAKIQTHIPTYKTHREILEQINTIDGITAKTNGKNYQWGQYYDQIGLGTFECRGFESNNKLSKKIVEFLQKTTLRDDANTKTAQFIIKLCKDDIIDGSHTIDQKNESLSYDLKAKALELFKLILFAK